MIKDLLAMQDALKTTLVPPRYVDADGLLRTAIAENVRGLELRNQAISKKDNAAWTEHKVLLGEALALFQKAYQAFPEDNRPQPAP